MRKNPSRLYLSKRAVIHIKINSKLLYSQEKGKIIDWIRNLLETENKIAGSWRKSDTGNKNVLFYYFCINKNPDFNQAEQYNLLRSV